MHGFLIDNVFFSIHSFIPFFIMAAIFILMAYTIIMGVSEWSRNNNSPKLNVNSKVVSKRMDTRHSSHNNFTSTNTSYFVTFEFDTGDRLELKVSGIEYGQLCEQDSGILSFQGRRYLGFKRNL